MLATLSAITINNYCKVQKTPIYGSTIPLRTKGINYNKFWKLKKNMFMIADFIHFLTKSILSLLN